jgi:DNA modification methylase
MIKTRSATLVNGDCIEEIAKIENESIDFSVFSPPFPEMYVYNTDIRDMSNCVDFETFKTHFDFLAPELFRVLKQGRNVAIHCMDLPVQKGKHGYIGLRDFSGTILDAMEAVGFIYHSRVTIWKNPVTEMQRTKALGLLHKQIKKDSTMSRVGIPDYVLIFRKDGERTDPVHCPISVDTWQKYASPVWMDIDYGDTLNGAIAREDKDEKHICPLQLPTIERLIALYTNEGDTVLTPFMGIGSEVFQAIKMKRRGYGIELKKSYFDLALKNVKAAEEMQNQQLLFA